MSVRPSLLLDFARTRMLDRRITFSRPSAATYFDRNGILRTAASGVPRFDFDPITGACKGLLIEEQRTNLLTYSEQFDDAAWGKNRSSITANAATAPDGTLSADRLVEDTTSGSHNVSRLGFSFTASATYTGSFYAKPAGRNFVTLRTSGLAFGASLLYFNLTTGAVTVNAAGGVTASSATYVGNGWYRCVATFTATSTTIDNLIFDAAQDTSTFVYTGDGVSGLFIWGAQLEAGAFPTSYIKTEAAQVTRAADVATMTGANFSSWYRQDEGTFVCSGDSANVGTASSAAVAAFKDSNNYQRIRIGGTYSDITAVSGGVTQVHTSGIALAQGKAVTTAMAYKLNDYAQSSNGGAVETDASATLPVGIDTLNIGATTSGSNVLNGHISRLAYYPKRLTNTELQALTA